MKKKIDLALQGGGSHGAFTWGVLERLLEDDRIDIDGVCGTSAGAMNAVVLAYGLQKNGRKGAIDLLRKFWKEVSKKQRFSLLQPSFLDKMTGGGGTLDYSPMYQVFDIYTMLFSPYQFNPLNINPLRDLLEKLIDFDELREAQETKLFVCATNVRTGRAKVFKNKEITLDALMASACLPFMFKAVEIDGEAYWDGGYMGNPPIFPLIDDIDISDILLVQINPINIEHIPKTADEIRDRINTISFNTSLMHEMRRVNMVQKLLEVGLSMGSPKARKLNIHEINQEKVFANMSVSSKLNADWRFIVRLKNLGRDAATAWIEKNYDKIGKESTCNIEEMFL